MAKELLVKIPERTMHLRVGMFNAELGDLKIDVALSGGSIIIYVEEEKWRKANPGKITPFRYKLKPETICDIAIEAYKKETKI